MATKKLKIISVLIAQLLLLLSAGKVFALEAPTTTPESLNSIDADGDGLTNDQEINIYHTDPNNQDTDGDGYTDGDEVKFGFDPNISGGDRLEKTIVVSLADQSLSYKLGDYFVGTFKISSGVKNSTPKGEYSVLVKKPIVDYKGRGYDYKNTRWNLMFKKQSGGNLYIHGAYWHNNFGHPMSHGCLNVSYANVEALYNWADVGTKIPIK